MSATITASNVTDDLIRALRDEARAVAKDCREIGNDARDLEERIRACSAALGIPTGDGALGLLDRDVCRARVAAILENARQCGTLYTYGADPVEYDDEDPDADCQGHPAGPSDPMGVTVFCDGTCRARRSV